MAEKPRLKSRAQGLRLRHMLSGEQGTICRIAWSPNGINIAAPSHDGSIAIWDAKSGQQIALLEGHGDAVYGVAWSPDGRTLASGAWDATIRLWEIDTRKGRILAKDCGSVNALSWKPGSSILAAGLEESQILLFDVERGQLEAKLSGFQGNVNNLSWAPDGQFLAAANGDHSVRVWESGTGRLVATYKGHASWAFGVSWHPGGRLIASSSWDTTVRCWDIKTSQQVCVLEGHAKRVSSCSFSRDGLVLASKSKDHTVRLWRCDSWEEVAVLDEPSSRRNSSSLAFHPSDPVLATLGNQDTALRIWDLDVEQLLGIDRQLEVRKYVSAKVVLVGESGVGKSGLAHRLIEDSFVQTDSTHGMRVWRLDLPTKQEENLECEALLWDLAGQEDYRLIHQLFLDETALALVLFNPQKVDPFSEVIDWLKVLRARVTKDQAREVPKILIAARVDVGGAKVGQQKIDRFLEENGMAAYLATSAKRGDNCSDAENAGKPSALKELIAKHIPWARLPWTSTPRLLANLKNAVIEMKEQRTTRMLRFTELMQRLEQALPQDTFGETDVRTAVTLLANHGLVMPLKFGDLILLRPELLNGYASAVIRAARAHTDEIGCVKEQDVFDRTINLEGVERLGQADEELLMRAMVQTFLDKSLCIAEDTPEGRHLIFPSQYRRERSIPQHPEIFVSYVFSGEWQTVYTTLVVRLWYSREFQHRELWRNAAEFETAKGRTVGLVVERTGEGETTLSVFFDTDVPDELKVIFIEYVHRHLGKYASDVRRDRRYVCKCGEPVANLEAVRKRLAAGKDFITCQVCDEPVPFIDFIEQRLASDPVARRVLGMDETATRELDSQALEQILTGHMMAICGQANQIFRELTKFDYGIDGEVEFKNNEGKGSGKKIYVQLKSGASYLRTRKADGKEIFDVKDPRHLEYWVSQPVDVYLVIRDAEETIRWMNVTRYLKQRPKDQKDSRQIVFEGEKLDAPAVCRVRDRFFGR